MDIIDGEWTMRDSQLQLIFDELKTAYSPLKHTLSGFEDLPTSKAVKPKVKAAQKLQTYVKCGFEKCPVEFSRTQNTPKIRSNHTALHLALGHTRRDERGLQQPKYPCGWCGSLKGKCCFTITNKLQVRCINTCGPRTKKKQDYRSQKNLITMLLHVLSKTVRN